MTIDVRAQALAWRAAARPAVVVEVTRSRGSVPREAGTRMLVAADQVLGSIGGGHLELKAIASARRLLAGNAEPTEQHYALGPALGQCCGGAVTLHLWPLDHAQPTDWPLPLPRFHLQLYGAGHVGRAIVHLLSDLPCRVQWIDERDDEFPQSASAPHIERLCVEPVEAEVALAPAGSCFLVLTHSHALDLAITEAILQRGDFAYLGLIGSATKRARFLHRFEARGIAPELLARITCPIGVPGIVGKEPEVIALGVVAQLLQVSSAAPDAAT
ncbi:MAG: xanthine dehydrogenase accessory protein XdhC [Rubrivivax sp.]|nr:xanthine dehydrogenase accessory protein XdhC [Rubrivivax sp.]MBK7261017.1 xanthine dehydrogenase accessory protein XdhC [Rubrivivax sp.]MBK8525952.1 xanthine dehydrogenase accessory protein XdhC [Rubrivivax sp.]